MIGGGMLLCAVGAMLLIAVWSLKYDEFPDATHRSGFLALRSFAADKKYKIKPQTDASSSKKKRSNPSQRPNQLHFDPDEMAEIEDEAEKTMPKFLRDAREEY